jgi:hypothetical protein
MGAQDRVGESDPSPRPAGRQRRLAAGLIGVGFDVRTVDAQDHS